MNAVDTNILIYANDPREERKRAIAADLISNLEDGVLLWQVACEYVSVARKLAPLGFDFDAATRHINTMQSVWRLASPSWESHEKATRLIKSRNLSWWDALLVAACLEAGVNRLFSEDFTKGERIETLEIVNPF